MSGGWLKRAVKVRGQILSCDSKMAHPSKVRAEVFANRYGFDQSPYQCQICGNWHLTSRKPSLSSGVRA